MKIFLEKSGTSIRKHDKIVSSFFHSLMILSQLNSLKDGHDSMADLSSYCQVSVTRTIAGQILLLRFNKVRQNVPV